MPFPLATNVATGQTGHADLHNEERAALNEVWYSTIQDSGMRDITASLVNGWTVEPDGFIRVRRVGKTIAYYIRGLNGATAADGRVFEGFPGFQQFADAIIIAELADNSIGYGGVIDANGGMWCPPGLRFSTVRANVVRTFTDVAWPANLPGIAV